MSTENKRSMSTGHYRKYSEATHQKRKGQLQPFRSMPSVAPDEKISDQSKASIAARYNQQLVLLQAKIKAKTCGKLLTLDFIIRNTRDLNEILTVRKNKNCKDYKADIVHQPFLIYP